MTKVNRQFVSVLAADCVEFSKHMLDNEDQTLESLKSCRSIIDGYIEGHGGRIFHTAGDSVLAEFKSPIEAVNCAINFQDRIFERNEIVNSQIEKALTWRVGIHCDEVIFEGQNVYGNGVNIAARLESQCPAGQILVSRAINEQVVERISAISKAAGEKKLKNISDSFEVFSISTEKTAKLNTQVKESFTENELKTKKPVVSMIPFKNLNPNEDSAFLIDGIFKDILTEFSMVRQLSVVSVLLSYYFCLRVMYWCHFVILYCKILQSLLTFKFHTHHICYTHKVSFPLIFLRTVSNFHLFEDTYKNQTFRKVG